jgi:PAS domain S-box-containing protein
MAVGPFVFLYAALVGFFAFAAVYHLILWWSSRQERLLLVLSAHCGVLAASSVALVAIHTATTTTAAHNALRARVSLGLLLMVTWLWSVSLVSGVRARRFVWSLTIALLAVFPLQALVMPLNAPILSVDRVAMPWGEVISIPQQAPPGWWYAPLFVAVFSIAIFGLYCGSRLWLRDRVAGTLLLLAAGGIVLTLVEQFLKGYGKLASVPFLGVAPHVFWVCAVAILIARARRQTREQLMASEHRFRGIFDQTFQFMGLIRTDGTLVEANRTALEFAGVREEDVIGKPFWETPWWAHSEELRDRLREAVRAAAAGATVRFEATHPRPDGGMAHVDFSLKPVHDERGEVSLLIPEGRDITEWKRADEARRQLESQLAQAQKMEAIGQLAGGVAHDFNNLLTVINGYVGLLQARTDADDPKSALLDGVRDASDRASALTRQLLTFSHQQVVEPRVLELNDVVAETERMLRRLIGEDVRLVTALDPDLACVTADPGQIGQVIINLTLNARDAMPTGGEVIVETRNVEVDEAFAATHPGASPGSYVLLAVTDTGCGMSAEVRSRIFEPFFTTKRVGRGTGLGLATVRTIVEQSGGFLSVASKPGEGSTFGVYLPALDAPVPARELDLGAAAVPGGTETILLAEDDDSVRALTREILQEVGYTVLEAPSGAEAVRIAERYPQPIDLLITDVVMPEMGGRKLVERLALVRPGLKVLYVSGYTDDAVVLHGVLQADVAFLQKPFTIAAIARKVRQTIDAPAAAPR